MVESLVNANANVNAVDLWKFTPLHEAAAKGKYEICKLLIKVGVGVGVCVCGRVWVGVCGCVCVCVWALAVV